MSKFMEILCQIKKLRGFNFLHNKKESTEKVHFLDNLFLFTPIHIFGLLKSL